MKDNGDYVAANQGWFWNREMDFIRDCARGLPESMGVILEVGSFKGRSTSALTLGGTVICIDPFKGSKDIEALMGKVDTYKDFIRNMKSVGRLNRVVIVRTTGEKAYPILKGTKIRLALIDGSHEYEDVRVDIREVWKMIVPGGRLVLDDMDWEYVHKAAREELINRGVEVHMFDKKVGYADKGDGVLSITTMRRIGRKWVRNDV